MRTFYFMGKNLKNKSKVSWKTWRIERRGKMVVVQFGPATIVNRKPVPNARLQTKSWQFRSAAEAAEDVQRRINEKKRGGYSAMPRKS